MTVFQNQCTISYDHLGNYIKATFQDFAHRLLSPLSGRFQTGIADFGCTLRRALFDAWAGNSNLANSLKIYPSLRQNENSHTTCHIGELPKNQTFSLS